MGGGGVSAVCREHEHHLLVKASLGRAEFPAATGFVHGGWLPCTDKRRIDMDHFRGELELPDSLLPLRGVPE